MLALVAGALALGGGWLAYRAARAEVVAELERAGVDVERLEVERLDHERLVLREVRLPPDLSIARLEVRYDLLALIRGGGPSAIAIDGAEWSVPLDADALRASALARLVAGGERPTAAAPRIVLTRSRAHIGPRSVVVDEGAVDPAARTAHLAVRSELGAHDVRVAVRDGVVEIDARPRGPAPAIALELEGEVARFRLDARAPASFFGAIGPHVGLGASGTVRLREGGWSIERVAVAARADALSADGARASDLSVLASGDARVSVATDLGSIDPELSLHVEVGAGAVRSGATLVRALAIRGDVALSGRELRARGPIVVRARSGSAAGIRAERVTAVLRAARDRPLLGWDAGRLIGAARFDARAPRARGALAARDLRVHGWLETAVDGRLRGAAHVSAARVLHRESAIELDGARVDLAIAGTSRAPRASGSGAVADVRWRDVPVGPTRARLAISRHELAIDAIGRATRSAPFALAIRLDRSGRGGTIHLGVPVSPVASGDPLDRVLAALLGLRVRGRAGGWVDVDAAGDGAGSARLALEGASVARTDGSLRARGVRGEVALARLSPALTAEPAPVHWEALELGLLSLGSGRARIAFEPDDVIVVDRASVALDGGRASVAVLRLDPARPDTPVDVALEGAELAPLVAALTSGDVHATGRLDGRVGVTVRLGPAPRLVLREVHVAARGPGRIRVERAAVPGARGTSVRSDLARRVVEALSDVEYRRLALDLVGPPGDGALIASVSARGVREPQELELAVRVHGVQRLVDAAARRVDPIGGVP